MRYYTGIGSRIVPKAIADCMFTIAGKLAQHDWVLRSGGAKGSDKAFESGATNVGGKVEIYRPKDAHSEAESILQGVIWALNSEQNTDIKLNGMNDYTKRLLCRNMFQVLGADLKTPSEVVICYTQDAQLIGGTRYAIKLAQLYNIKIINLGTEKGLKEAEQWIDQVGTKPYSKS